MTAGPVTKSQVYAIQPEALSGQITEWTTVRDTTQLHLDQAARDYAASTDYWIGAAGDRARSGTADTASAGHKVVDALTNAIAAATSGQSRIATSKRVTIAAIELTEKNKFTVAEDGTVTAPDAKLSLPSDATAADITKAQAALDYTAKHIYEPAIKQALAGLGQILEDTATAIDTAFESIGDAQALPQTLPVQLGERSRQVQDILDGKAQLPDDPRAFHDFWTGLGEDDKDALWLHDQYLGNRDGMPAVDRDHYNRLKLEDEMTRAAAAHNSVEHLKAQHPDWAKYTGTSKEAESWLETRPGYTEWKAKWDAAHRPSAAEQSKSYDDLRQIYEITHDPKHPGRMLLQLDSLSGDRVHTVIADGNPDTASHVTTYVPGTSSRPSAMGPDMGRIGTMTDEARLAGAAKPVSIAWFGYDAPPEIPDARHRDYADAAATDLDRFQDGLRVSHEGAASRNTVLGHSYGTTLVGDAAAHGRTLNADAVVFVASPGVTVDHVSELSLTGVPDGQEYQHVFSTKAANDPVPLYPLVSGIVPTTDDFGPDPTGSGFGGQVFASAPGSASPVAPVLTGVLIPQPFGLLAAPFVDPYNTSAHSQYWDDGNVSAQNMGRIIAGSR
ncbi:alpha/beta hydrolase [Nocardia yamanashiensis]|uniref:alpha/beta hydrolase n=1 Tax=Nocardia yamanashiensis TaxID=209247 RepID=UPI00082C9201|nr:alpha/beta hydrolase [Nocardia yamanashiensis]